MSAPPAIWWVRRDFRLADNAALRAALDAGGPVIPVVLHDEVTEAMGAAPRWRFGRAIAALAETLAAMGSRLVLRRGRALEALRTLCSETGARSVHWERLYDPDAKARDMGVKDGLAADGLAPASHAGHVLHEPWTVETGTGGYYKVYSPYWRAVQDRDPGPPHPKPRRLPSPDRWPASDRLEDWTLGAGMDRGAAVVARHARVGEAAARERLRAFLSERLDGYAEGRNYPAREATSGLSENLTWGEIGVRTVWAAGMDARAGGSRDAETFLKEIVWREFSYHLLHHTPHIVDRNWRTEFDGFAWKPDRPEVLRWKQGRTGVELVDAAMREMFVTGTMHNRARMVVGSYLTKHMLTDWRVGRAWFEECLIDWDPASNAMGWQWVAGSGPDAAPYFRVFNPDTQAAKFDPEGAYRRRFVAELAGDAPGPDALAFFEAAPRSWGLAPDDDYPDPVVPLAEGRRAALEAYAERGG